MTQVTASMVKELRGATGVGMMDAKKALVENNGDMDAAVDWLRTKGMAKAAKKAGRIAAEGLVAISTNDNGTTAAVVEINSETDFVARNDIFQTFVRTVAGSALAVSNDTELKAADMSGKSIEQALTDMIAKIGENMSLRRMEKLSVSNGVVASYMHNAVADNLGKIGVLIALESDGDKEKLQELGRQIAMHVAAVKPECLDQASVDPVALERERNVLIEQARESGKPDNIIEKMIDGRMRKYYEEICLMDQAFIMDNENKISDVVANAAKELGTAVELRGYVRYALGEGIEKEEVDFAAEVAATAATA
ncbi:MAG: elongation factor Ts [Alphaproteobacteria bacterium]|nr:elongation factor Ts [Alphaproteobacteria bacterium]